MSAEGIYVCVRVRPLNERELKNPNNTKGWVVDSYENTIQQDVSGKQSINFDRVFDEHSESSDVYNDAAKRVVDSTLQGINGTVFAYGQTSSGKTYSMGAIMQMGFQDIFQHIKKDKDRKYTVKASYVEIYNENITDLLEPEKNNQKVQDGERGPYIPGLLEKEIHSLQDALALHEQGTIARHTGATLMNEQSSRSHTIFQLSVQSEPILRESISNQPNKNLRGVLKAVLNFVDLAGSERASSTGAQGQRLKEGSHINKSLLTLGTIIRKLSEMTVKGQKNVHVPFRDSKLTRILQPALGGNSRTTMLCCITQASVHIEETMSTLGFAHRAKLIQNQVGVNEVLDDKTIIAKLKDEIMQLRTKLNKTSSSLPSTDPLLLLDDNAILNAFKQKLGEDSVFMSPTKRQRLDSMDSTEQSLVLLASENEVLRNKVSMLSSNVGDSVMNELGCQTIDSTQDTSYRNEEIDFEERIVAPRRGAVKRALLSVDVDSDCEEYDEELDAFFERTKPIVKEAFLDENEETSVNNNDMDDIPHSNVLNCQGVALDEEILPHINNDIDQMLVLNESSLRRKVLELTHRIYELHQLSTVAMTKLELLESNYKLEEDECKEIMHTISEDIDGIHIEYDASIRGFQQFVSTLHFSYQKQIQEYQAIVSSLKQNQATLDEQVSLAAKHRQDLEERLEALQVDLEETTDMQLQEQQNTDSEVASAKNRIAELLKQREELDMTITTMTSKMTEHAGEMETLHSRILEQDAYITNLKLDMNNNNVLQNTLEVDVNKLQESLQAAEEEVQTSTKLLAQVQQNLQLEKEAKVALETELDELKVELREYKQHKDTQLTSEREDFAQRELEMQTVLNDLKEQILEHEQFEVDVKADFQQKMRTVREEMELLKMTMDSERESMLAAESGKVEQKIDEYKANHDKLLKGLKEHNAEISTKQMEVEVELHEERIKMNTLSETWEEERNELGKLCDELEERLVKERASRVEMERLYEISKIEAASSKAVLEELRNSHVRDEELIERRIATTGADKDRHIDSLERRIQVAEDRSYRDQKLVRETQEEVDTLKHDMNSLLKQVDVLKLAKSEAENAMLQAQGQLHESLESLKRAHKLQLQEAQLVQENLREMEKRERDVEIAGKVDRLKQRMKEAYGQREDDLLRLLEEERLKVKESEEDYQLLKEDYASLKRTMDIEFKKKLEEYKLEWKKTMTGAVKEESKRAEQQVSMNTDLKQENEDLRERLRSAQKQLQGKEESLETSMKAYQEKIEGYMTEKIMKLRTQVKKASSDQKDAHEQEMKASGEVERLRSELERQKLKNAALQEDLKMKDTEMLQKDLALSNAERKKQEVARAAALSTATTRSKRAPAQEFLEEDPIVPTRTRSTRSTIVAESPLKPISAAQSNIKRSSLRHKVDSPPTKTVSKPAVSAYVYSRAEFLDETMAFDVSKL